MVIIIIIILIGRKYDRFFKKYTFQGKWRLQNDHSKYADHRLSI